MAKPLSPDSPVTEARYVRWLERDLVPDRLIRLGIRQLLAQRLEQEGRGWPEGPAERLADLVAGLRSSPVALHTDAANAQHYEVPAEFYRLVLGPNLKYSCALWADGTSDLGRAEEAMLDLTCRRARLGDGQDILELGCGWGSLSPALGGAVSFEPDPGRIQFPLPEGAHRPGGRPARPPEP